MKSKAKKTEAMKRVATSTADGQGYAVLLTQGILSGDEEKIESVIKNSDNAAIISTVKKLPVVHLIPFLNLMEARFRNGKGKQYVFRDEILFLPTFKLRMCILGSNYM